MPIFLAQVTIMLHGNLTMIVVSHRALDPQIIDLILVPYPPLLCTGVSNPNFSLLSSVILPHSNNNLKK